VIAKGLAVMYKEKPEKPVDFLAKWLLNYSSVKKKEKLMHGRVDQVTSLKDKYNYQQNKMEMNT
jgi:Dpy-30 motif